MRHACKYSFRKAVQEELKTLISAHNKEFNPTGVPFKANRTSSGGDGNVAGEEEIAVSVPTSNVLAKAALQEKVQFQEIAAASVFEFLFTETSELWVHGLADGVISANEALFPMVGKFLTGQAAVALKAEGAPQCIPPAGSPTVTFPT
jgi:hypothetical protein